MNVSDKTADNPAELERESRKVEAGYDILDNNSVNALMAAIMSVGAMVVADYVWA